MRTAGLVATLVAGLGLLGASLHGLTRVDATLRAAVTPAAPPPQFADENRDRCHRERGHHPRV
jgi:hypothetical protein